MFLIKAIKNVFHSVAASINEVARKIVDRYTKWRERLRQKAEQRRQHKEYINEVIQTTIPYHPENTDEKLVVECKQLIKRIFPQGVEQTLLKVDIEERVRILEQFANETAKIMNIQINDMKYFTSHQAGNGYCGFYDHNNRLLAINIDFIACDRPEIMRDVINTILHECKHSRQYFAIVEGVDYGYSKELLQSWYRNTHNYIKSQECDEAYRKQPLELDSFGFADSIIKA